MTDTIEELERLLAAATEGPWNISRSIIPHDGQYDYGISSNGAKVVSEAFGRSAAGAILPAEANGALIVALRNAAPSLIAKLKAVTAERDAMAEALAPFTELRFDGFTECSDVTMGLKVSDFTRARKALEATQ